MRILSVLVLLVCVQQGALYVSAQCRGGGGPGFPLPIEPIEGYGWCAKGFYCPNSDPKNKSTQPRYCPPDRECQEKRKEGEFCEPQSPLEPEVCHSGKYCPTGTEMLPCPEGKWCPYGTHEPHDCHALMHCPEGTNIPYDYSSILFMLILDILAVVFYIVIRKRRRAMWVAANEMDEELKKHEPKEGAEESHEPDTQNQTAAMTMPNVPEGSDPANPASSPEVEYHAGAPHAAPSHSVPTEPHPHHIVRRPHSRIKVADNSFLSRFIRQAVKEANEDEEDVIFVDPIDPSPNRVGKTNAAVAVSDPNARRRADILYEHDREIIATGVEKNRGAMQPLLLRFGNLSVSVNVSGKEKVLLKGITGAIRPGRVTAIMGPSGAGKTVFMTRLLNKGEKTWKTDGELRVNGFADSLSPYQHMLGYVPQDDIMHPELSVLENVWFSAENRLPKTWKREERLRYVIAVIRACGLESVMHTPVGTGDEPNGVSRKRTSIAIELAGAPSAIFLDEPTTGLDSATALDLCALLKSVAVEAEMTVAMVIHQPRVEIWDSLDEVLLIAPGGRTVYQGPQKKAQEYFEEHLKLDFSVGNPADIILDGIAEHQEECESAWEKYERPEDTTPQRKHQHTKQYEGEQVPDPPKPMHANFFRQILLFHYRSVLKQAGHAHAIVTSIVMGIIAAAIMGSAAVRTELIGVLVAPYSLMNPRHNLYLVPMLMMFYGIAIASSASAPALRALCDDRTIYWKEASTGRVNKIAYFIGMTTGEFYRLILTVIHFTVVAYFMWNPAISFWWFFFFIAIMFSGNDAQAAALGLVMSPKYAPLLATVVGVFIALLNGFPDIPGLYYIAFPFYCTEGFLNRFSVIQENVLSKEAYDRVFRYHFDRLALDIVIAILIVIIYRVIGFLLLVFTFRNKQR